METLPFLVVGYLLGSIPFGLLLTRLFGGGDIRAVGSGNIGATNVLRTGRKGVAAATLLLDLGKGALAVLLAIRFGVGLAAPLAAAGAFFGHVYPIWLRFRGGKGVATLLGISLGFSPWGGLGFGLVWLVVALVSRISSLGGMMGGFGGALALWLAGRPLPAATVALLSLWVLWTHRANIRRLRAGTEPRIGR